MQQLYKLICVQKVQVMKPRNSVERQLLLVKVKADVTAREGLMRLVDIFKAKVLDVTKSSMVLQITGENDKIDSLLSLLEDYGILELVRTGVVALERGEDVMTSDIFDWPLRFLRKHLLFQGRQEERTLSAPLKGELARRSRD